jgi:AraC-like DNA-binding protein
MYREQAPEAQLRGWLQCTWTHRGAGSVLIVPDACVDLLWDGQALWVAGPDTRPVREQVCGLTIHGVRLRTGCAQAVLGTSASALCNGRMPLSELWEVGPWLEALQREPPARVLSQMVRPRQPPDPLIEALVARLESDPARRIALLARELGVSERQLNRRCTDAVGYGPKLLGRILRMQNVARALRAGASENLARLALRFGFTDQAHLGHEAAELYGTTPTRLRARSP